MLTIAIPVRNEAPTIGVLLWRVRTLFQDYPREYDVIVYDDGSSDGTPDVLAPYAKALPLTVLGGAEPVGYPRALDALLREAARRTRYPRRDAVVLMQGDFTDLPDHIPELVKRFEGGADMVIAERVADPGMPAAERRIRTVARWLQRPLLGSPGTSDPFGTYRLIRLSTVREFVKARGDQPLVTADGWGANFELFHALRAHAKRIEAMPAPGRFDLRQRESRRRVVPDSLALLRTGLAVRRRLPAPAPRPVPA